MNNIKSTNTSGDSSKTPGGISKSLLTPIRRVGLSRNWKNSGSSFISPLSNTKSTETKPKSELIKRKAPEPQDGTTDSDLTNSECSSPITSNTKNVDLNRTPIRNVLSRKKPKTLLSKECLEESDSIPPTIPEIECENTIYETEIKKESPKRYVNVSKPMRAGSKSISKGKSPFKLKENNKINKTVSVCTENKVSEVINDKIIIEEGQSNVSKEKENCNLNKCDSVERKSPNLTKDCVVVIQNKIFKCLYNKNDSLNSKPNQANTVSDSDSDDVPPIVLNKKENEKDVIGKRNSDEDDDFETKKVVKLQEKSTSISGLKQKKGKNIMQSLKPGTVKKIENTPSSQSSITIDEDEDDDFEFKKKKTILIKKTYEKAKPIRAKSTGSITQKDINEITYRIENKKKMLLATAMIKETVELRDLIKKWQTGCQNALTELLELMKTQMPDKQNMEYSEILQMLNIPSSLVGYDSENECFITPSDESIIMSRFNI